MRFAAETRLENSFGNPFGQSLPHLASLGQFSLVDPFGGEDFFWRLRLGIDDPSIGYSSQPPPFRNAIDLPFRAFAIAPGSDDGSECAPFDTAEDRIIAAVEHFLHFAAHARQIFGTDKQIARRLQDIVRLHIACPHQSCAIASPFERRFRKRPAAAGAAVPDDQEMPL